MIVTIIVLHNFYITIFISQRICTKNQKVLGTLVFTKTCRTACLHNQDQREGGVIGEPWFPIPIYLRDPSSSKTRSGRIQYHIRQFRIRSTKLRIQIEGLIRRNIGKHLGNIGTISTVGIGADGDRRTYLTACKRRNHTTHTIWDRYHGCSYGGRSTGSEKRHLGIQWPYSDRKCNHIQTCHCIAGHRQR